MPSGSPHHRWTLVSRVKVGVLSLLALGGVYQAMWNRQREVDAAQEALRRAAEEEGRSRHVEIEA